MSSGSVNILGIDPANHTGLAWIVDGKLYWDSQILKQKKDESRGVMLLRFEKWIKNVILTNNIAVVGVERVSGRGPAAVQSHSRFSAIIERLCADLNVQYTMFSAKEIKLFAADTGNASKELMIQTAQSKWGYTGNNDNEADAIAIVHLLQSTI